MNLARAHGVDLWIREEGVDTLLRQPVERDDPVTV